MNKHNIYLLNKWRGGEGGWLVFGYKCSPFMYVCQWYCKETAGCTYIKTCNSDT